LLDEILLLLPRYLSIPTGAAEAIVLWCLITYCYDIFEHLPILGITSPERRCGKTELLTLLSQLIYKGYMFSSATISALFRTVNNYKCTLLIDEGDTFLINNEDAKSFLNSSHTKSGAVMMCSEKVDDKYEPTSFSTWGPKVVAMIGDISEISQTVEDRSIEIKIHRKAPSAVLAKIDDAFRRQCLELRARCQYWADANIEKIKNADPIIPDTNNDRNTDNWRPLFQIAEVAGGAWPKRARDALLLLVKHGEATKGTQLLADIAKVYQTSWGNDWRKLIIDLDSVAFSRDIVTYLRDLPNSIWENTYDPAKQLNQNTLAQLLRPYGILPKTVWIEGESAKGYKLRPIIEMFDRYSSYLDDTATEATEATEANL